MTTKEMMEEAFPPDLNEVDGLVSATAYTKKALSAYYKAHKKSVSDNVKGQLAELLLMGAADDVLSHSAEAVATNEAYLRAYCRSFLLENPVGYPTGLF